MIKDFTEIILQCIDKIDRGTFWGIMLIVILMGALCWVACNYYTKLWHKSFHVKFKHHILCFLAAIMTVIFSLMFYAVSNLETIVDEIISEWAEALIEDDTWSAETYHIAFYSVKDEYPREFAGVPEPGSENSYIPFNNKNMMQICISKYVEEACAHFSTQHPFLDIMLSAQPGISEEEIIQDINEYFRTTNSTTYPLNRAIEISTVHIRNTLFEQSPKTVWKTRLILIALFFAVQLIPFGTIGYCAYKDLKKIKTKLKD